MTTAQPPSRVITRGDELASSGPPLQRFRGKFVNLEQQWNSQQGALRMKLQFTELEVIKLADGVVGYNLPVFELDLKYSDRGRSTWGALLQSAGEQGYADLLDLRGHTMEMFSSVMVWGPDRERLAEDPNAKITGLIWSIAAVDGEAPSSGAPGVDGQDDVSQLIAILDGKDETEFGTAAVATAVGKRNMQVLQDSDWLAGLVAVGRVTRGDDGKYHKVA
jgi:hypothetical protein